jgi:hypothetical protein
MIRALEARNQLEGSIVEGVPHRPTRLVGRDAGYLQSVSGSALKLELEPGAKKEGTIAGVSVTLEVIDLELVVSVAGEPEVDLELVLENDSFEKFVRLEGPVVKVALGRWMRAEVRASRRS